MSRFQPSGKFKVPAKKSLGQNYLNDQNILAKIIDLLNPKKYSSIVEIGCGPALLTELVLKRIAGAAGQTEKSSASLLGFELDHRFEPDLAALKQKYSDFDYRIEDFLKFDYERFKQLSSPRAVFGNIPYHLSSPILIKLLNWYPAVDRLILMVQKEFFERIAADFKTRQINRLSAKLSPFYQLTGSFKVSRNCFTPPPRVDSVVCCLEPRSSPLIDTDIKSSLDYFKMVDILFSRRRRLVKNSMLDKLGLDSSEVIEIIQSAGFEPSRLRAEEMTLTDIVTLTKAAFKSVTK